MLPPIQAINFSRDTKQLTEKFAINCFKTSFNTTRLFFCALVFGTLACSLLLATCSKSPPPTPAVPADPYTITFVTLNSPTTYYFNGEKNLAGIEYDLAMLFVKSLGAPYQAKFLVVNNISQVIPALQSGQADIAASDLSVTDARKALINFATPYQTIQQQLIYNRELTDKPPRKIKDLVGHSIVVPVGTSFAERLRKIQKTEPDLKWEERPNVNTEQLIEAVAHGEGDYTVADSHLVSIVQNYYPNLEVAMPLGEAEKTAWALPKQSKIKELLQNTLSKSKPINAKSDLLKNVNIFFARIQKDGTLRNVLDRYLGNAKRLDQVDIKAFLIRSRTLLPQYIKLFKHAQEITDIDWRLLAAISYQESHWDTFNTSPTNVRGLMMLTEDTADLMGVTDRLDPKQSIPAGAKYVMKLKDVIPEKIAEPDRTYMALAAYNIGYAHVEDARVLAQRQHLNPNSWADVKKTLVMLNNPDYYTTVKYGYASGGAPVIFVESIRSYQRILERYQPSHNPDIDTYKIASN